MPFSNVNCFTGTSGLVLPIPKSLFPAEFGSATRLQYYASLFNSIEINSSFYKTPQANTVARWATEAGPDFRFTFKLSKEITHVKELLFNPAEVKRFMQIISQIGNKKACLLIQFPAGVKIDKLQQLENLLTVIGSTDPEHLWNIAVEFRHTSWYNDEVYMLLKKFRAALVLHDIAVSAPPIDISTAGFVYIRFHGAGGLYRGSYSDDVLKKYAALIKSWNAEGKTVYCYFNNTMGAAVDNLGSLNHFVQDRG